MDASYCPTSRTFYWLRSVLMRELGLDRHDIRPSQALADLIPEDRRREVWRQLRRDGLALPPLRVSWRLRWLNAAHVLHAALEFAAWCNHVLGLVIAFPLGFTPVTQSPTGLGRWAHDHRVLGVAILLIPTLILLVDEVLRRGEVALALEADDASLRSLVSAIPRRFLIGAGVSLVALIWMAGTNGSGLLLGLGIAFAVGAAFLWRWHRSEMRRVTRDLRPPEKT